jgi:hypothetical protein
MSPRCYNVFDIFTVTSLFRALKILELKWIDIEHYFCLLKHIILALSCRIVLKPLQFCLKRDLYNVFHFLYNHVTCP